MNATSRFVLTMLANAAWQTPLVALAALAGSRLARSAPARHRHAVWLAALALSVALPVAGAWRATVAAGGTTAPAHDAGVMRYGAAGGTLAAWLRPGAPADRRLPLAPVAGWIVLAGYAVFLVRRGALFARAWRQARALREGAVAFHASRALGRAIERCAGDLGVEGTPVLVSWEVVMPVTVGALRPAVILPSFLLAEHDEALLVAALGHELAHVRRRDYAAHVACELLSVPFAFHPAVAYVRRKIRETRELACDERVTERLQDARVYARSLVEIARSAPSATSAGHTLGVVDADTLEERVMRLIDDSPRAGARAGRLLALAAFAALALVGAAASAYSLNVTSEGVAASQGHDAEVVGTWKLYIWTDGDAKSDEGEDGLPAILDIALDGGKLAGTATVWPVHKTEDGRVVGDESKKVVMQLVKPTFDGHVFSFEVFNGEERLVGELEGDSNALRGRWISTKSKHAGTLKMVRK